ncbi:RbsD/FucU family protein (plasmid) [Rhizobium leguminosarum]|nr:RbsD/FucU family protein [Rhizobium leguminosarum]
MATPAGKCRFSRRYKKSSIALKIALFGWRHWSVSHFTKQRKKSFAIVRTSDPGPYGCFIFSKGVI